MLVENRFPTTQNIIEPKLRTFNYFTKGKIILGYKDNESVFVTSSVLLGQLGKELLGIAYQTIKEVYNC